MNLKKWTFACLISVAAASCIQDEALNSEAAIDACTGTGVQLADVNADEKKIRLYVQKGTDISQQELIFTLPEGAVIKANEKKEKDNGVTIYDFSEGDHTRTFTVTSENGEWKAIYTIQIIQTELPTVYRFEELQDNRNNGYDTFIEEAEPDTPQDTKKILQWSSGNPGFKLTGMAKSRTDYPTVQTADGYRGNCVKLETRSTGEFGKSANMHIAAGNLFIGNFDIVNALINARAATKFGFQFFKKPLSLNGYFKFKAGPVFTESGKENTSQKDRFDIYAILYEAEDPTFMLDGGNAMEHPALVAMARIEEQDAIETDTWTRFELPFKAQNGKAIDSDKLAKGQYKLGIVFSSSVGGAYFNGAVGSTLYIDEVELICEE